MPFYKVHKTEVNTTVLVALMLHKYAYCHSHGRETFIGMQYQIFKFEIYFFRKTISLLPERPRGLG